MRAVLPANWVFAGYGVPHVCSRHGEPAVERAKILAFVVGIGGLVVITRSARAVLARARASHDGAWLEVVNADRRFAEQVAMLAQQPEVFAGPVGPARYAHV